MNKTTETVIQTTNEMIQNLFIETSWSRNMRSLLCNSMVTGEDSPEAWGWIFSMIPKEISGTDEQVSIEEKAIYLALCLYAATAGDRTADCTMVEAMKYLDMDRIQLTQIELSENLDDMRIPLYMLGQRIVSKGRAFNYAKLAGDLYLFQMDKMKVIRKWEREFI